jgi:hypothetical protein
MTIEHQHRSLLGADSSYRPADRSVERHRADHSEKCDWSHLVQQDRHGTNLQFAVEEDLRLPLTKDWQCVAETGHHFFVAEVAE